MYTFTEKHGVILYLVLTFDATGKGSIGLLDRLLLMHCSPMASTVLSSFSFSPAYTKRDLHLLSLLLYHITGMHYMCVYV